MHSSTPRRARISVRGQTARALRFLKGALACTTTLTVLAGCVAQPSAPAPATQVIELQQQLEQLQAELVVMRQSLADRSDAQAVHVESLEARLSNLQTQVESMPEELAELCPAPPAEATVARAPAPVDQTPNPPASTDKLVVGELERVWLEPPGAYLVARMDAGVESNTLSARDVVIFERDGRRWVRFNVAVESGPVTIERPLRRNVRVSEGGASRRPAVTLRLRLGKIRETVEVTLVDLPNREYGMILGRNFITDLALLDVSQKFVQPAYQAP
jgi:outer membrane murein-binding lipoprotein Lpp